MNKNLEQIKVKIFNTEIGIIAYDTVKAISYFQYSKTFLNSNKYKNIFPFIIKRVPHVQIFKKRDFIFRNLPSVFADSLPDSFGNQLFNIWADLNKIDPLKLSPIHQLAYLGNRAMGALEFFPSKTIIDNINNVNLNDIYFILNKVLENKKNVTNLKLNELGLLNILKMGFSAGGARAKVIVSEHKITKQLIPGDINISDDYNHYLIKFPNINDKYNRELVEYSYYLSAIKSGINMMPTKLVANKYLATQRYDRQNGNKIHVLTASGISGISYQDLSDQRISYNYLFEISNAINISPKDMQQLFTRMVFNFTFHNVDDHFKNHSFMYNKNTDRWALTPAYDINYSLDALNKWQNAPHNLALYGKRTNIKTKDLLKLAYEYNIKDAKKIIHKIYKVSLEWKALANKLKIPNKVIDSIQKDFKNYNKDLKRGLKI